MPDVEQIFRDYVAEHRGGGEADPRGFLARVDESDRAELAALIDAYLAQGPGKVEVGRHGPSLPDTRRHDSGPPLPEE